MAQELLISCYFPSSILLLLLLLLLHPTLSQNEEDSDAAHLRSINGEIANRIGTPPFIFQTCRYSVTSSRRTVIFSRKPCSISPLVVRALIFACYGSLCIVVFWMAFASFCLRSINNNMLSGPMQNPSILLAASGDFTPSVFYMGDDLSDEYGIVSRRRIRARNQASQDQTC